MKDYHLHSGLLDHTDDDLRDIIKTVDDIGFEEVAITEHFNFLFAKNPNKITEDHDTLFFQKDLIPNDGRKTTDLTSYFNLIEKLDDEFNLKVLKGLEVDYFKEYENDIKQCLSQYKIDIVLGSCHYITCKDIPFLHVGDSDQVSFFIEKFGERKLYHDYFNNVLWAVKSGLFDYMAHLDLLKKGFKNYDYKKAEPYINKILKEMIKRGVGLEINISGLKYTGETYPARNFIKKYQQLGGKNISLGSDSHSISRIKKMAPGMEDFSKLIQK